MEKNRLKIKTPPLLQIRQAKTMKISVNLPSSWQQPSSQAPSSQEPKEGDEDYEVPPPVPR